MSEREDQLIDERHMAVMGAIGGIHDRLDILNGRTRAVEVDVSVLKWGFGVLGATFTAFVAWLFKG